MPFITEELFQKLPNYQAKSQTIVLASYPEHREDWISETVV